MCAPEVLVSKRLFLSILIFIFFLVFFYFLFLIVFFLETCKSPLPQQLINLELSRGPLKLSAFGHNDLSDYLKDQDISYNFEFEGSYKVLVKDCIAKTPCFETFDSKLFCESHK